MNRGQTMRTPFLRRWLVGLLFGILLPVTVHAYVLEGYHWPTGKTIVMNLQLGSPAAALSDGSTTWNQVAVAAMNVWNPYLGDGVQFQPNYDQFTPKLGDKKNSVYFGSTVSGEDFGSDTLAVTSILHNETIITETDVTVDNTTGFDSYRGPLRGNSYDLRRVLIHELGHVLGLDHAPDGTQSIMLAVISNLDSIQNDDVAGVDSLYGTTKNPPLINSALSADLVINKSFQYQSAVLGSATSYQASGLPTGLHLNTATGLISGTTTSEGTATIKLTATNAYGSGSATLILNIFAPPTVTSPPTVTAFIGQPFRFQITGAHRPQSFSFVGSGPALQCDPDTGVVLGSVTAPGQYSFTLGVSNIAGSASAPCTLTVAYDTAGTTLYATTADEGTYGFTPLTLASDGNFYGTCTNGGTNGAGTAFRVTPAGDLTVLHAFDSQFETTSGSLVAGADGNLYGLLAIGGGNGTGPLAAFYRLTPDGTYTVMHTFTAAEGGYPGTVLIPGPDGNFYGTKGQDASGTDNGMIFKITPDGDLSVVRQFTPAEAGPPAMVIFGADGNLYGVINNSTFNGAIFKVSADGTLTILHNFSPFGVFGPSTDLAQGMDGSLYGIATATGSPTDSQVLYRVTLDGQFTTFSGVAAFGKVNLYGLSKGKDGFLYAIGTYNDTNGSFLTGVMKYATDGTATLLHTFTTLASYDFPVAPTQGTDGALYDISQRGVLTRVTTAGAPLQHPAFFDKEVSLGNGVCYMDLDYGAIPFGYYSYLADSRYIYHFDLGYEYVFDALDNNGGVYFYDFKSSTFFYTSTNFVFPYLYDFSLKTVLYYYPDPNHAGHYNTKGVRYFYNFATGKIITK